MLLMTRSHTICVVQALLGRGARVDAANKSGVTALHAASFYGHEPVVVKLLQCGANARLLDARKRAALHWAALNDQDAVKPYDS
jgi:ankyrin